MATEQKEKSGRCSQIRNMFRSVTVEPLMLLDGLAFCNMHVYMENLQMERVCRVGAAFADDVCLDLKAHPEASVEVQQRYSVFAFYNGIIAAALPLFFILFMGAWSDKYGRKVPLVAVQLGHCLHAAGYLLVSLVPSWPAEVLLLVTLLDTLGGGAVSFLTVANSYVGDVSSEESRTSRVGLANSIWFLGGPIGTLMGTYIYSYGGYLYLFATSLSLSMMAVTYVIVYLPESHGPFARKPALRSPQQQKKEELQVRDSVAAVYGLEAKAIASQDAAEAQVTVGQMAKDFFNPRRIIDSFRSTLRRREGNTRAFILILIFTSLLRRVTRSPYVFAFTRHALGWEAVDYSLWVTYKNVIVTAGSLVAVPLLSGRLGVSDNLLAVVGATSGFLEYITYGCISKAHSFLIWIAPVAALLLNSCNIAQRAMMTKFVLSDELGKVSAVLGALDGMMPMVNSSLYTAVYHATVSQFPAAQFFLGASASALMIVFFCIIIALSSSREYDLESAKSTRDTGPVTNTSLVLKTEAVWLTGSESFALAVLPSHVTGLTRSEGSSNVGTPSRKFRDVKGTAKALQQLDSSDSRDMKCEDTVKALQQLESNDNRALKCEGTAKALQQLDSSDNRALKCEGTAKALQQLDSSDSRALKCEGTAKALQQLESSDSRDVESRTTCKHDDQLCCNKDDSICNINNQTTLNTENKIVYYINSQFINDNEG